MLGAWNLSFGGVGVCRIRCDALESCALITPPRLETSRSLRPPKFRTPYAYCIVGFISIWLIYDISDNVSVFIDQKFGLWRTAHYYLTQLPQNGVILLPISLLLALLYSLGRMSRSNEIVSMLTAGISIPRVLFPLIFVGFLTVWATYALNYELAPHGETARRNLLMSERVRREVRVEGQIFRNRTDNRTWFIQSFRKGENRFHNVQVLQQDQGDKIITDYIAFAATFDPAAKTWELWGQNRELRRPGKHHA